MIPGAVADTGPLIAFGRADKLELLYQLYGPVLIPDQVENELRLAERRPGTLALERALQTGWLCTATLRMRSYPEVLKLSRLVDRGEAEAIALADELELRLIIDDRRGRQVARARGIPVIGSGAVLWAAKRRGQVERVAPLLDRFQQQGYWISLELRLQILQAVGEA